MKKVVSVIIPVYNVEEFIFRTVESVMNQDYKNIEIILVNDGSLDNSAKIIDELAKKDDRITCVHKENGGVSSARNAGLRFAIYQIDNSEKNVSIAAAAMNTRFSMAL